MATTTDTNGPRFSIGQAVDYVETFVDDRTGARVTREPERVKVTRIFEREGRWATVYDYMCVDENGRQRIPEQFLHAVND